MSRSALPGPCRLERMMWVWSSKTKRSFGGPPCAYAWGTSISIGCTSKKWPNTSFIAMNDAAKPPVVVRNLRRDMPSRFAACSESAARRASTSFCLSVWPIGMYSPFDTIWVGIGECTRSAWSAGASRSSWASLNQASSSRYSGFLVVSVMAFGLLLRIKTEARATIYATFLSGDAKLLSIRTRRSNPRCEIHSSCFSIDAPPS